MYKVASDRRQAGLHHGKPADWINGVEKLSPADQLRQMQEGVRILNIRIAEAHGKPGKRKLTIEKYRLEQELVAFKAKHGLQRKGIQDEYGQIFIDCAKDILSPVQFNIIKAAAQREVDRRKNAEPAVITSAPVHSPV